MVCLHSHRTLYEVLARLGILGLLVLGIAGCGGTADQPPGLPPGLIVQGTESGEVMPPAYQAAYLLQPSDELRIVVLGNQDLTSTSLVRSDGTITVPGAGVVQAGGVTPEQLGEDIESRLTHIIRQPSVDVLVTQTAPPGVYVAGEVFSAGFREHRSGLSLFQALSMAGVRDTAKLTSILLMRRTGADEVTVRRINLKDVLTNKEGALDPLLAANDMIFVPKSFIASWKHFIDTFLRPAAVPLDLYTSAWFAANVANENIRVTFR